MNDTVCTNVSLVFARPVFPNQEDSGRTVKRNKRTNQHQFGQIDCFLRNIRQRTGGHAFLLEFSKELTLCVFPRGSNPKFQTSPHPLCSPSNLGLGVPTRSPARPGKRNRPFRQGEGLPSANFQGGDEKDGCACAVALLPFSTPGAERRHVRTHARPPRFAPLRQLHCIPAALSTGSRCCEPVSCRA